MTVWSVCITVTGGTVVCAAVIEKQLGNLKREVVFGCVDRRPEVPLVLFVLFDEKLHWSSVVVLSIPEHGVAVHAEPWTHAALKVHCDSWGRHLISRLKNYNSETCST